MFHTINLVTGLTDGIAKSGYQSVTSILGVFIAIIRVLASLSPQNKTRRVIARGLRFLNFTSRSS